METRRLEYFVTLIREGTFRRAAAALYISQPALSQQIQRLEQEIGAVLINRSVTPFELTPAGRRLLARSQKILDELHEIEQITSRARRGVIGKIRVGVAPSLMYSAMPGLVREFRVAFPDIELTLHRETTQTILDLVEKRRLDLGMTFSQAAWTGLQWVKLYDDSFVVALPAGHPLASRASVRVADLQDETFLMLMRQGVPDLHDAIIAACASAGFSPRSVESNFQVAGPGYADQIGLVAAGYGIAVIPSAVATVMLPGVVYRPLVEPVITLPTSLCWSADSRNPAITTFVDYCSAALASEDASG